MIFLLHSYVQLHSHETSCESRLPKEDEKKTKTRRRKKKKKKKKAKERKTGEQ